MNGIYTLTKPDTPRPLIFDSPHSGTFYPEDFRYACDFKTLERAEDKYVDALFNSAPHHRATLLCAHFPRSYIDPNRSADDIDPALLNVPWDGPFPIAPSPRSDAGIGLIRRLVRPGIPVYDRTLSSAEIIGRIDTYYRPYHAALKRLIEEAHYNFGQVWHINCHSMPASTAHPRCPVGLTGNKAQASDFVLGNRDGTSCCLHFTRELQHFLKGLGYTVTLNDPFKGVELVERYSDPARGFHSLQIEINKALYMDENTQEKSKYYNKIHSDIQKVIAFCSAFVEKQLTSLAAD